MNFTLRSVLVHVNPGFFYFIFRVPQIISKLSTTNAISLLHVYRAERLIHVKMQHHDQPNTSDLEESVKQTRQRSKHPTSFVTSQSGEERFDGLFRVSGAALQ